MRNTGTIKAKVKTGNIRPMVKVPSALFLMMPQWTRTVVCAALFTAALLLSVHVGMAADKGSAVFIPSLRITYDALQINRTTLSESIGSTTREGRLPNSPDNNGAWMHSAYGDFAVTAEISDRVSLRAGVWARLYLNFKDGRAKSGGRPYELSSGVAESYAKILAGKNSPGNAVLRLGLFNVDYNPDNRDLGEYLLQSGAYPGYVYSGSDSVQQLGVHFQLNTGSMTHHALVTSELRVEPLYDFSFSYIGELRVKDVFTIGAGIMYSRALAVTPGITTQKVDISTGTSDSTDTEPITFSHSGVKVMARAAFDPKPFLPFDNLPEDELRIYSEAAILGVKDYPYFYEDISDRIPVMWGFNAPTHPLSSFGLVPFAVAMFVVGQEQDTSYKDTLRAADSSDSTVTRTASRGFSIKKWRPYAFGGAALVAGVGTFILEKVLTKRIRLDRMALEAEWYDSPFTNNPHNEGRPYPVEPDLRAKDNFKWAMIAEKKVSEGFTVTGKVANDHLRLNDDPRTWTINKDHWYWSVRFDVQF